MDGSRRRHLAVGAGAALAAMVLASCTLGLTETATGVGDVHATLQGRVMNEGTGTTTWWFEWGPTTAYGNTTPTGTVQVFSSEQRPAVEALIQGLDEATTYHYRLCALDIDDHGGCGVDQTLTTSTGFDSVSGHGTVFALSELGYSIAADIDATSAPGGGDPVGTGWVLPGQSYFRLLDEGPVTCLRVEGNRAAVGLYVDLTGMGAPEPYARLLFIEDNGPTGDRMGQASLDLPATTCPVPTADDFPPYDLSGILIPPVVTGGDFVVHDHGGGASCGDRARC